MSFINIAQLIYQIPVPHLSNGCFFYSELLGSIDTNTKCFVPDRSPPYSAGSCPGHRASQILSHGKEQLRVEMPHDSCKQVFALRFHPGSGVCSGGWGRDTSEGPWRFGCSTQSPLLGAKGKCGAKGKIRGTSHFLTPWWGTEEVTCTGRVPGAFPFHPPSPVLYTGSLAELSSVPLA